MAKKSTSNAVPNPTPNKLEQSEQNLPKYDASPIGQKESNPSRTPPPGPSQSRITGEKQFSKPMKIQKKKFQMDMPDPKLSGLSPNAAANQNRLNIPGGRSNNNNTSLSANRNGSSSGLNRDASANRLVEDKYLGPSKMKIGGDG